MQSITVSTLEPATQCSDCPPGTAPHSTNRLLSFQRDGVHHQIPTCDARVLLVMDEELAREGTSAIAAEPLSTSGRVAELELENAELALELQHTTDKLRAIRAELDVHDSLAWDAAARTAAPTVRP